MGDVKDRSEGQAAQAGGAAMGALIGISLGGPFGALAGAVLAPAMQRLVARSLAEFHRRGDILTDSAAKTSGMTAEQVSARVTDDIHLQPLVFEILDVAARTNNDEKLRVLGRVLGQAVVSGDSDEAKMITRTLRDLEPTHVAVLGRFPRDLPTDDEDHGQTRTHAQVKEDNPEIPGAVVDAAMGALVRHSLVVQLSVLWNGHPSYQLTGFGRAMLEAFEKVRDDDVSTG
jgi:hypothetical protein